MQQQHALHLVPLTPHTPLANVAVQIFMAVAA
jgi:hypothetical protein